MLQKISILRHKVSSHPVPPPFLLLSLLPLVVPFLNKWGSICRHSSSMGWNRGKLDFGVDYGTVRSSIRSHTTSFSLNTFSGLSPTLSYPCVMCSAFPFLADRGGGVGEGGEGEEPNLTQGREHVYFSPNTHVL